MYENYIYYGINARRWEEIEADYARKAVHRMNGERFAEIPEELDERKEYGDMSDNENGTGLSIYQRMPDALLAIKTLGESIAKSKFFKCESVAQGEVIAMECLKRNQAPLAFMEEYHVIPTMGVVRKYDYMLARFNSIGGRHKILERSSEAAEIGLEYDGQTIRERLTWEEAKGEKWPFCKDGKTIKDNWATPRARRQMLWARVVTEGLRALCPQATGGYYAPEEFGDTIEDQAADAAEDVTFTVEATEKAEPAKTPPPESNLATREQVDRIVELYVMLDIPTETREKALKSRKVGALRSLSRDQAGEIIAKLEAKAVERQIAAEAGAADVAGTSQSNPAATVAFDYSPANAGQVAAIKGLIAEVEQLQPGTTKRIKDFLTKNGKQKIADLCSGDAERLIQRLGARSLDAWFAQDLAKAVLANQEAAKETTQGN